MLDRHLFSSLGAFPITQITAPQLLTVFRPIEETGKTDLAHTLVQHASAIFRFAMAISRAIADPAAALLVHWRRINKKTFRPSLTQMSLPSCCWLWIATKASTSRAPHWVSRC